MKRLNSKVTFILLFIALLFLQIIDKAYADSLPSFVSLALGNIHSCGLANNGQAYCWGENGVGEAGNGHNSLKNESVPVPVDQSVSGNFVNITAGFNHSCGLNSSGQAYCWGSNDSGQLGIASSGTLKAFSPLLVAGNLRFSSISAGDSFTCALEQSGQAYCWGKNNYGQLGNGNSKTSLQPSLVDTKLTFTEISAGGDHTCALATDNNIYCWGNGTLGQLGDGGKSNQSKPSKVRFSSSSNALSSFSSLSSGYSHTCITVNSSQVYCWGKNNYGQLGIGNTTNMLIPTLVTTDFVSFIGVSASGDHTCALTDYDEMYCWGYNNSGQAGTGSIELSINAPTPVNQIFAQGFKSISLGGTQTCAISDSDDRTYCWGGNQASQLGVKRKIDYLAMPTPQIEYYKSISLGAYHSCELTTNGNANCWGKNDSGQLGNESTKNSNLPTAVTQESSGRFINIATGDFFSCGITTMNSKAYCWGSNNFGQLGNGDTTSRDEPTLVSGNLSFNSIVLGYFHSCGISMGQIYCWGNNTYGQLNLKNLVVYVPTLVSGGLNFISIFAGDNYTCGLTSNHQAYCWGINDYGQLGNGNEIQQKEPILVAGELSFNSLYLGSAHSCGLTSNGQAYCWGKNNYGQLGIGNTMNQSVPTLVATDVLFKSLALGTDYTCGITSDNQVYCWGRNGDGQLGNGARSRDSGPALVVGGLLFSTISAGNSHTCGITLDQQNVYCWGYNGYGQLGIGSTSGSYSKPMRVNQ